MSASLLGFYGIALALIFVASGGVYLLLRRYGRLVAIATSLLAAAALVLLWPIPIHGGFILLGGVMYEEWSRNRTLEEETRVDQALEEYLEGLSARFAGELPLEGRTPVADGWEVVAYGAERRAWLDTVHRQIWSEWLWLPQASELPSLEAAKGRCAEHAPVGYWSLPTEAEHALMWKAGGTDVLPDTSAGSVAFTIDAAFRLEMPTYRVVASGNRKTDRPRRFAVRCIARGPDGPERGFIKRDIPLEDWNRYQLSKST